MIGVVVTMHDIRACKMCSKGTKAFFKRHSLDYSSFVKNGIPAKYLADTGDAMALRVVEEACNGKR